MSALSFLNLVSKEYPYLDFLYIQKLGEKAQGIVAEISTANGREIGILTGACYGRGPLAKGLPSGFSFLTEDSYPDKKILMKPKLKSFRVLSKDEQNGLSFLDKLEFAPKYIEDLNALVK